MEVFICDSNWEAASNGFIEESIRRYAREESISFEEARELLIKALKGSTK